MRDSHTYLHAYCYYSTINGLAATYVLYRLDRIIPTSLTILPTVLPPYPPPRPVYTIRYTLGPMEARRRDIAHWFDRSETTFAADGSAHITATTPDLWQARQVLLRYREHCRVLDPPELVVMMRESIQRMAALYTDSDATAHRRNDS